MIPWTVLSDAYTEAPEAIALSGGSWREKVRFHATAFLLQHPVHGPVLVDTGYSHRFAALTHHWPGSLFRLITKVTMTEPRGIRGCLEALGIAASDVRHVIITHFHADHIGGLLDFPDATVYCSEAAWEFARRQQGFTAVRHGILPGMIPADLSLRLKFVTEGSDVFGDGTVRVLSLPGHAPGQIGLEFVDATAQRVLLAADACWLSAAFRQNVMPHRITTFLHQWNDYKQTLRRLHALHLADPSLRILPSHCPEVAQLIRR